MHKTLVHHEIFPTKPQPVQDTALPVTSAVVTLVNRQSSPMSLLGNDGFPTMKFVDGICIHIKMYTMHIYMCIIFIIYLMYKRVCYILMKFNKNKNIYTSHFIIFCWLIWFEVKFRTLGPFAILPETPVSFNGSVVEKHCF